MLYPAELRGQKTAAECKFLGFCRAKLPGACALLRQGFGGQFSFRIGKKFGGADRDQTDDLVVANDALYQLSYCPEREGRFWSIDARE